MSDAVRRMLLPCLALPLLVLSQVSCSLEKYAVSAVNGIPAGTRSADCIDISGDYEYLGVVTSLDGDGDFIDMTGVGGETTLVEGIFGPISEHGPRQPLPSDVACMHVDLNSTRDLLVVRARLNPPADERDLFELPMACINGRWLGSQTYKALDVESEILRSLGIGIDGDLRARVEYAGAFRYGWPLPYQRGSFTREARFGPKDECQR